MTARSTSSAASDMSLAGVDQRPARTSRAAPRTRASRVGAIQPVEPFHAPLRASSALGAFQPALARAETSQGTPATATGHV